MAGQIDKPNVFRDFLNFLGNTNFQAIAANQVFGVTARAFAINTGQQGGEDFPVFLSFWIAKPKPGDRSLTIYGVFDSEHSPGWLKFVVTPGYEHHHRHAGDRHPEAAHSLLRVCAYREPFLPRLRGSAETARLQAARA